MTLPKTSRLASIKRALVDSSWTPFASICLGAHQDPISQIWCFIPSMPNNVDKKENTNLSWFNSFSWLDFPWFPADLPTFVTSVGSFSRHRPPLRRKHEDSGPAAAPLVDEEDEDLEAIERSSSSLSWRARRFDEESLQTFPVKNHWNSLKCFTKTFIYFHTLQVHRTIFSFFCKAYVWCCRVCNEGPQSDQGGIIPWRTWIKHLFGSSQRLRNAMKPYMKPTDMVDLEDMRYMIYGGNYRRSSLRPKMTIELSGFSHKPQDLI